MSPIIINTWKNSLLKYKIAVLAGFIILCLTAYHLIHQKKMLKAPPPKVVEVETLTTSTMEQTITLIGTLRPKHATPLVAKSSGLLAILRSSGQQVKKGELIAKIINPDLEKNYRLSKDTEQIAQNQYQRVQSLHKTGFVSVREIEEKKQVWIDAQKERAKTKIELKNTRFYAPFDGIVGAFKIKEGTQVSEGTVVVTIYDPEALSVELDLPCTNHMQISKGQKIYLLNKTYSLTHVQKMIDDDSHMCPADVDIEKCPNCLIGTAVRGQLVIKQKSGILTIPTQALFLKDGQPHVYKVVANQVKLNKIETGIQEKERVEIRSGLKPGDQIVLKNPERLYPGAQVSIYKAKN